MPRGVMLGGRGPWGKNLLNEKYDQRVFFFGNEDPDYLEKRYEDRAAPRQLGITAAYRF